MTVAEATTSFAEFRISPVACGGFPCAAALACRRPAGAWDVLVLPAAWVAGELARSRLGTGMARR